MPDGACESDWVGHYDWISTQDFAGSNHAAGICVFCVAVSWGIAALELFGGDADDSRGGGLGVQDELRSVGLKHAEETADITSVKLTSLILAALFIAMLVPEMAFAKKKSTVGRPASKPPVYKKFDNRKKKNSQLKMGRPHR